METHTSFEPLDARGQPSPIATLLTIPVAADQGPHGRDRYAGLWPAGGSPFELNNTKSKAALVCPGNLARRFEWSKRSSMHDWPWVLATDGFLCWRAKVLHSGPRLSIVLRCRGSRINRIARSTRSCQPTESLWQRDQEISGVLRIAFAQERRGHGTRKLNLDQSFI